MPLRKLLSLGKKWVLERCNLMLRAVFSRLPIRNHVFFYTIRADGKLLENSKCVYDALEDVEKVVVARMLPHPVLLKPKIYYHLLTSRVIVTDDYLRYLRHTQLREGQKVVQIWHACGAFKRFGLDAPSLLSPQEEKIMIASIFVKLWMYFFNSGLSRKINSTALKAAALDSLTDCIATSVVIIGLLISASTGVQIDGWLGVCVSLFILFTGVSTFRESLSPLLGKAPDAEFVDEIKETVLKNDMIVGIHDLIIHDYGPGRCFVSLHAEVPCDEDILEAHDAIDLTEKQLENRYNCFATIHMDPIASNDAFTNELKMKVEEGLCELNPEYSIHDFRIVKGSTHTNVVFDMVIPYGLDLTERQIKQSAIEKIKSIDEKLYPIINVEKSLSD